MVHVRNRFNQRNMFRAGLDAILRITAIFNAALGHERALAFFGAGFSERMIIEKPGLIDGHGADKFRVIIDLRANF